MNLVIIEGVGKLETVQKYLGKGYKVFATGGHVRDLPQKRLAVDVNKDFEPTYVVLDDKKKTVDSLKAAARSADNILLATDPDREGEAISWHVATLLDIPEDAPVRIEFNEISKTAVQNALSHPRVIDKNLVDAQQARRVLDRLVGYKVSPILCTKIQSKLSAGRVQSVTLRLVVEREKEIRAFVPEEYWTFFAELNTAGKEGVRAALVSHKDEKLKPTSESQVDKIKSDLKGAVYTVTGVKKSITHAHPYAPFITSTMQQDAMNKLGMSLKQTSSAAQTLYEGVDIPGEGKVALITYIRTDSTRVSKEAIAMARDYIADNFGDKYLPDKPNYYASKKSAQDAHEAIRPISLDRTPASVKAHLNKYQYQLYDLIYKRFLASQMADADYNSVSVDITANDYGFHITGRTPIFDGFTKVYAVDRIDKESGKDEMVKLPEMQVGDRLDFVRFDCEQKFTKPPARYTEASLVKAMEERGIGRPATYSPTVNLLFTRKYVVRDGRAIAPTELGEKVTEMLIMYFPSFMSVDFTAKMEDELDGIEDGGVRWQNVIKGFYGPFEDSIKAARADDFTLKTPDEETDYVCEKCGAKMVIKNGRFGKFLACSDYPKCKNTKNLDEDGNIAEPEPVEVSDTVCEKCGAKMVVKTGKYGKFLACPNYPKCKNIVSLDKKPEEVDDRPLPPCPKCGKLLKKITTRRSTFYGCTGYPDCNFTLSARPNGEKCPQCGSLLVEKSGKNGDYIKCSNKTCNYKRNGEKQ
ncbi:MAG: type I DNA topoisomerase [Clostridiales bacterium]|nr:type I DNA topoisomerase [Clostridiales bacterium]